jgi:hypothetical protein
MRFILGLIIVWLLVYDNAVLFKLLHSFLLGLIT